jgi:hypothetical protein
LSFFVTEKQTNSGTKENYSQARLVNRFLDEVRGTVFAVGISRSVFKIKSGPEAGKTVPPSEFLFEKCNYARPSEWLHEDKNTMGNFFDTMKEEGETKSE